MFNREYIAPARRCPPQETSSLESTICRRDIEINCDFFACPTNTHSVCADVLPRT
jgi:hypothetical protein